MISPIEVFCVYNALPKTSFCLFQMSDSLRDQLLKAGFSPKNKPEKPARKQRNKKPKNQSTQDTKSMSIEEAQAAARQANKAASKAMARQRYQSAPKAQAQKQKTRKAPAVKPRAGGWGARSAVSQNTAPPVEQVDPKTLEGKTEIHALIQASALKSFVGDETYRFTLQSRIHEVHVSEPIRQQLVDGTLAITRQEQSTHIIPADTAQDIRRINPHWLLSLSSDDGDQPSADDDDFPVPDDLIW